MADTIFVAVVLLRFGVPLLIPRFPLAAIVACLVIDAADQTIFQAFTDDPLEGYQAYDKALDVYYLAIAYCSSMRNWRDPAAFSAARGLYLYRLVGVTLFELLHWRWLLLAFPNTFEYFFIAYESVRTRWNPRRLGAVAVLGMVVAIWVFVKLPQEWWIHIAKLDFTQFMSERPYMWGVLAGVAAAAGVVGWRWRSRVPEPDWSFTMDVTRHLPQLPDPEPAPGKIFDLILLEKVVFIALVSVIFAQILPDVKSSNLGIAIGVAALVVLNAAVSEWFRRRGRVWTTTLESFVAMLAINTGIVFADAILGPGDATPTLNTLFFVVLLSLLIAMFDLMRATRGADDLRTSVVAGAIEERRRAAGAVPG